MVRLVWDPAARWSQRPGSAAVVCAQDTGDGLTSDRVASNPATPHAVEKSMGVFNGSVSVTKFFVEGAPPKKFAQSFVESLRLRTFQALTVDGEEEEASGWCAAGNGMDLDLSHEKVFLNAYLVTALRVDRWRIPRPLFKAQFDAAQAEYRARTGKEKLSKRDKDELKFKVNRRLRRKVIPVMRVFDLSWDLNRGEVWFWNRALRVNEDMAELFERTFSLKLTEAGAYVVGQRLLGAHLGEQMLGLEPSLFAAER